MKRPRFIVGAVSMSMVAVALSAMWVFTEFTLNDDSALEISNATPVLPVFPVRFSPAEVDLGRRKGVFECKLQLLNSESEPIAISKVSSSCSCTVAAFERNMILPGKSAPIPITINLNRKPRGVQRFLVSAEYSGAVPGVARGQLLVFNDANIEIAPSDGVKLTRVGSRGASGSVVLISVAQVDPRGGAW